MQNKHAFLFIYFRSGKKKKHKRFISKVATCRYDIAWNRMWGLHFGQHGSMGGLTNAYAFTHSPYTWLEKALYQNTVHGFVGYTLQDSFWGLGHFVIYSRRFIQTPGHSHAQCREEELYFSKKVKVYMHARWCHVSSPDCTRPYVGITLGQTRKHGYGGAPVPN